ncbi:molybdenum cofactor biosynthesis protein [Methanocella sp. CWC-04]|uniref:Molybdenum cofactor biosynthesis protein n=1 Tax=Methanooceanicella nereidis TaxID=2052831 RepID=A0AAP2W631_9EURY|nr:MogA/MoaB family molybdenum cofactor biosynthesis protein [Methanocella sp. CWC-04]MCD1296265.1 molybdenum cofactor biosynthesis protein [Methanocella sp. CWC-04]
MGNASHEKHKEGSKGKSYTCGVLTVSTSRYDKYGDSDSPEKCEDESGKIILDALKGAGHKVLYRLLSDDRLMIESTVMEMFKDSGADAVIVCGGTGLTASDVTIEAITPMLQKVIPGFGELFRIKSYEEIGTASVLTRAMAGVVEDRVVFCIPGSPNAARLAVKDLIIPELGHIVSHIRK